MLFFCCLCSLPASPMSHTQCQRSDGRATRDARERERDRAERAGAFGVTGCLGCGLFQPYRVFGVLSFNFGSSLSQPCREQRKGKGKVSRVEMVVFGVPKCFYAEWARMIVNVEPAFGAGNKNSLMVQRNEGKKGRSKGGKRS